MNSSANNTAAAAAASASTTNTNNAASQLESKLHTVAASFRQKRDEAHRGHQLAAERLRLATEECLAVENAVATATTNLGTIQEKAGGSAATMQERNTLQAKVAHLQKEVHFQHTELVLKRSKLDVQRTSVKQSQAQRASALTKLKGLVQQRRVKQQQQAVFMSSSSNNKTKKTASSKKVAVVSEYKLDVEQRLVGRWPHIVRQQAEVRANAAGNLVPLSRIASGYQSMLASTTTKTTTTTSTANNDATTNAATVGAATHNTNKDPLPAAAAAVVQENSAPLLAAAAGAAHHQ